jgi:hypothetical protein
MNEIDNSQRSFHPMAQHFKASVDYQESRDNVQSNKRCPFFLIICSIIFIVFKYFVRFQFKFEEISNYSHCSRFNIVGANCFCSMNNRETRVSSFPSTLTLCIARAIKIFKHPHVGHRVLYAYPYTFPFISTGQSVERHQTSLAPSCINDPSHTIARTHHPYLSKMNGSHNRHKETETKHIPRICTYSTPQSNRTIT